MPTPKIIVLATVPSDRDSKTVYKISLDRHNMVFCTCKNWRYNGHTCPHLTAFRAALAAKAAR